MDIATYTKVSCAVTAAIWGLFAATHAVTKPEFNRRLGSLLKQFDLEKWLQELPSKTSELFDLVFTSHPLSAKFVSRSVLASLLAYFFILAAFFIAEDVSVSEYFIVRESRGSFPLPIFLALLIGGNLVPDYVSLLETRYLVRRLMNTGRISLTKLFAFLILDLAATFIIFNVCYAPIEYVFYAYRDGLAISELWRSLVGNFAVSFEYLKDPHLGWPSSVWFDNLAQFCSTFATSVWIWLFMLATLALRLGERIGGVAWIWLRDRVLDLEQKPMLALGWTLSTISVLLFFAVSPFIVLR